MNHLTLAVSDLERSFRFYTEHRLAEPVVRWQRGAYLTVGELWLCLSLDQFAPVQAGYTHYAFSVSAAEFAQRKAALIAAGVVEWKANQSEGESFYFLDPDGHQLELHVGDLRSRLASLKQSPYQDLQWFAHPYVAHLNADD